MNLNIKYKVRLGTIFLLVLLLLCGGSSVFFLHKLRNDARQVLTNNYESLEYCHAMQAQTDSMQAGQLLVVSFDYWLQKEEQNITEPGEKEAAAHIRTAYQELNVGDSSVALYNVIRTNLQAILQQNMQAIERKNIQAEKTAETASTAILIVVSITLLVGITFAYNFPAVVVTPIKKLLEAIEEISRKNYAYKIHLETKDEFGQLANAFNQMSSQLEAFENSNLNKLLHEKARAEAVINSLKDASIGIDKNNHVLFANQQALQLLSLPKEAIVGLQTSVVAERNQLFDYLLNNETAAPIKIVVDGRENYYIREVFEVAHDGAANKVIVLKNITSFKELDVAKTNFIATVSHELKTPLASSDFSLRLLEDGRISELNDEQKELVQQLRSDNQRMLKILSELLNMTQAEAGKVQLKIDNIAPAEIVQSSIMAVQNNAREKNIQVEKILPDALPLVQADADKLGWVLNNFLSNAIRYSPEGSVVKLAAQAADNEVSFSVTDNGPGIDKAYTSKIFDRYFQIPGRQDRNGSGIGLAICKELIEAMGGTIWVKSKLGEGSSFGFDVAVQKLEAV